MNGIDDNLANSRLRTGMQNFWFVCDIPVSFLAITLLASAFK